MDLQCLVWVAGHIGSAQLMVAGRWLLLTSLLMSPELHGASFGFCEKDSVGLTPEILGLFFLGILRTEGREGRCPGLPL